MQPLNRAHIETFQNIVRNYFAAHKRDLSWRRPEGDGSFDPYKILVSEVMLQQTQVTRVVPKFEQFMQAFPTVQLLASASLGDVLRVWSGLGYNRRAKFLWQAARLVVDTYGGQFPTDITTLQKLPGVGINTAGAILSYTDNQPTIFIETNIRTVFIHHFFKNQTNVPDSAIRDVLEQTLQGQSPREWYWALMDYGTHLKAEIGNLSHASKHYAKQSAFTGSKRQVRGQILRLLTQRQYSYAQLTQQVPDSRLESVLSDLEHEGLIKSVNSAYRMM